MSFLWITSCHGLEVRPAARSQQNRDSSGKADSSNVEELCVASSESAENKQGEELQTYQDSHRAADSGMMQPVSLSQALAIH